MSMPTCNSTSTVNIHKRFAIQVHVYIFSVKIKLHSKQIYNIYPLNKTILGGKKNLFKKKQ
jgi:N-acetylmuramoyl-L-alanine amidase CwlA